MPEVLLKQTGKETYQVETPGGVVRFGGSSPGPMTTTAAALVGCLAMSLSDTLTVMRQKIQDIEMRASFERKKEEPKIFDQFKIHIIFRGQDLSQAKIEKAIHLSEEKTCPMSVMMRLIGVKVETSFSVEQMTPAV
ncbi:MAG TPA: OsmC family protein [Candidatus Bathyarchaeia archaeon]|nr:OsmC family protein [Candidatus Bathyarchaeia archaeon]